MIEADARKLTDGQRRNRARPRPSETRRHACWGCFGTRRSECNGDLMQPVGCHNLTRSNASSPTVCLYSRMDLSLTRSTRRPPRDRPPEPPPGSFAPRWRSRVFRQDRRQAIQRILDVVCQPSRRQLVVPRAWKYRTNALPYRREPAACHTAASQHD